MSDNALKMTAEDMWQTYSNTNPHAAQELRVNDILEQLKKAMHNAAKRKQASIRVPTDSKVFNAMDPDFKIVLERLKGDGFNVRESPASQGLPSETYSDEDYYSIHIGWHKINGHFL